MYDNLQMKLATEVQLAEGQWLEEEQYVVKLRMFLAGTRKTTLPRQNEEK
jgi:hypothetical protein